METRSSRTVLANAVLLTANYANSTNEMLCAYGDQITLHINYSPDTDSTNALNLQIDFYDGASWHIYGGYTNSSGTLTEEPYTVADDSAGTSDQLLTPLNITCQGEKMRVRYKETNTPADYGNITVIAFQRPS